MADIVSNVSTLVPGDSASQVEAPSAGTAPSNGKASGRQKRSAKNAIAKDTPPGAVKVPPGGQAKTGKVSQPTNATIQLTGWDDLELTAMKSVTIPTFTVDVNPFLDLVDAEFDRIYARCPTQGKFLPYAMFRYYCVQLWWFRAITLRKQNGLVLSSEEKNFLNSFSGGEDFQVPTHIAQYLANMGNFSQGGEMYFFRLLDFAFTGEAKDEVVEKGWLDCGNQTTKITNGMQFWAYAQLPVPAVAATAVCKEYARNLPANPNPPDLDHVTPDPEDEGYSWTPTNNIAGWTVLPRLYNHVSHRSTMHNLGWTHDSVPVDMQTSYLFSPSTMRAISDRLLNIKELKCHASKQLTLSNQGSPIQAYWIASPDQIHSSDHPDYSFDEPVPKASLFSQLALLSRFGVDPKSTTPAFDFGYRLGRDLTISGYEDRQPVFNNRSNYQPWMYVKVDEDENYTLVDPPPQYMVGMNQTLAFGSGLNLNVIRFETQVLRRDDGLQRSLVLVNK